MFFSHTHVHIPNCWVTQYCCFIGITWIRDSCSSCDPCLAGRENICEQGYQGLYLGSGAGCWGKEAHNEHGGCFSKVMRIESKFAIQLPDALPSEVAGK